MKNFFKNSSLFAKVVFILCIGGGLWLGSWGIKKIFPKHLKKAEIKTKATGLPPLAYDKSSNAPIRKLPVFNEAADVQAPEVRGAIMGWNGFSAANYAIGGQSTSRGSICEELGLNIRVSVQNSCTEQGNQLYAFAQALSEGDPNPSKGVHFVNWMADGAPAYLAGLNARLIKDFGEEYRAQIVTFTGASFGEDKWMVKPKFAKDARGSLTCTVIRDGDWNIAVLKSQLMGWPLNHNLGTYDKTKVNFVAAPNDDYVEAGKMYIGGQKVTLKLVENGKLTGKDTSMAISGVGSWFPVDQQIVQGRGGMITLASTKEFGAQMACGIVMIKKWCDDNRPIVEKMVEAFGKGGDQIKSHNQALQFASQVNEVVFADKEKTAEDWYKAYMSFDLTDEDGNVINIGGSRAFSIADAAAYTGISGGSDKYKQIYNTFGTICIEAYPEVMDSYPEYTTATDWSYLRAVYSRNKSAGTEGATSKVDFTQTRKGAIVGDANYSIEFNTGSATIKPESYPILDKILGQVSVASNTFVEIAGHTDNVGDPNSNMTLSNVRAAAVKQYLISHDPDLNTPNKLSSKGFGETSPLPNTQPSDGRNRRVEIKLFKSE